MKTAPAFGEALPGCSGRRGPEYVERRDEDIDVSLARLSGLRLPAAAPLDAMLDGVLAALTPHDAEDDIALPAARVRYRES